MAEDDNIKIASSVNAKEIITSVIPADKKNVSEMPAEMAESPVVVITHDDEIHEKASISPSNASVSPSKKSISPIISMPSSPQPCDEKEIVIIDDASEGENATKSDANYVPVKNDVRENEMIEATPLLQGEVDDVEKEKNTLPVSTEALHSDECPTEAEKVNGVCYCGGERKLTDKTLQCRICRNWYHSTCVKVDTSELLPYSLNYVFLCQLCSTQIGNEGEVLELADASWKNVLTTAVANLIVSTGRKFFGLKDDIVPYVRSHWPLLCKGREQTATWWETCRSVLLYSPDCFVKQQGVPGELGAVFSLAVDSPLLLQVTPNKVVKSSTPGKRKSETAFVPSGEEHKIDDGVSVNNFSHSGKTPPPGGGPLKKRKTGTSSMAALTGDAIRSPAERDTPANISRGGFPTRLFTGTSRHLLTALQCLLCQLVVRDPRMCPCSSANIACRECFGAYINRHGCCPCPTVNLKGVTLDHLLQPPPSFMERYAMLTVSCVNEKNGCRQSIPLTLLANHLAMCPFSAAPPIGLQHTKPRAAKASQSQRALSNGLPVQRNASEVTANQVLSPSPRDAISQSETVTPLTTRPSQSARTEGVTVRIPHSTECTSPSTPLDQDKSVDHAPKLDGSVKKLQQEVDRLGHQMALMQRSWRGVMGGVYFWQSLAMSLAKRAPIGPSNSFPGGLLCPGCALVLDSPQNLLAHALSSHYEDAVLHCGWAKPGLSGAEGPTGQTLGNTHEQHITGRQGTNRRARSATGRRSSTAAGGESTVWSADSNALWSCFSPPPA